MDPEKFLNVLMIMQIILQGSFGTWHVCLVVIVNSFNLFMNKAKN